MDSMQFRTYLVGAFANKVVYLLSPRTAVWPWNPVALPGTQTLTLALLKNHRNQDVIPHLMALSME
jgi:hypothetical protein